MRLDRVYRSSGRNCTPHTATAGLKLQLCVLALGGVLASCSLAQVVEGYIQLPDSFGVYNPPYQTVVDYNPGAERLFVIGESSEVLVVDAVSFQKLKRIPILARSICYSSVQNKLYVAELSSNSLDVVDGSTYEVVKQVPLGDNAEWLFYNPIVDRVYCGTYTWRVLDCASDSTWSAQLRCDSGPWHNVSVGPRVPETVWVQVPRRMYNRDSRIIVELARVTGSSASLAKLKLFQIEPEPDGREGVQSTTGVLRTRLLGCTPSPFSRIARFSYELGQAGPVTLTVHDISGKLIRRLESGYRTAGKYEVGWNATDDRGRRMPAGIYFLRFMAGGQASSRRLTLIR